MKSFKPTCIIGALMAIALGLVLLMVPRAGHATPSLSGGEFPAEWFSAPIEEDRAAHSALIGKPMPLLDLSEWRNGERKAEDLKGKVVIIDFWSTFCAPCIAAFPDNNKLYAKYGPQGLEFIGICTNTAQSRFDQLIELKKPEYPIARDANLKTMEAWHARAYPMYVAIDRKGIVRAIGIKHEFIDEVVERLLKEEAGG